MNEVISVRGNLIRNLAVRDLALTSRQQARSVERLASGSRLTDSSEDPGAYAVLLKWKASGRALDGVQRGLMNALSFLQAQAEGLQQIAHAVDRMNELATLVQDPTQTPEDASAHILEINQLREEIVSVQARKLNEQKLYVHFLGETTDPLNVSLGDSGQTLHLTRSDFSAGDNSTAWIFALGNQAPYVGVGTDTPEGLASFGQKGFEMLLQSVSSMLATNGAEQSRVLHALEQVRTRNGNLEQAGSRVSDVDVAREVTRLGRMNLQMDASRSVLAQANMVGALALRLLGE